MGNTSCNNAVPCLGSEPNNNRSQVNMRGKGGVTAKNRRSNTIRYDGSNARNIDSFINEQRD